MPANKHLKAQQVAGIMHVNRAAYEADYILLLESLSPQYREVFDAVLRLEQADSADIKAACNITHVSQASTMLNTLEKLGLLTRRLVDAPRRYVYEVVRNG